MKVFISQPMRGKTTEEILEVRKEAIEQLQKMYPDTDIEVIDFFNSRSPVLSNKPCWSLGESIKLLSTADLAVFVPGWFEAFGCSIEHQCAIGYGINTLEILI